MTKTEKTALESIVDAEAGNSAGTPPPSASAMNVIEPETPDTGTATPKNTAPPPDDFPDLSVLRLDQSFAETAGVKKLLTTVPVRKPNKQEWVRVHPSPEYREMLAVIELRDDRETYLLLPHIARELPGEFVSVVLQTAINRQDVVFLWSVKLPGPDGKQLEWHRSAAEAAELAMTQWVRVKANMTLSAYEISVTESKINEPQWTDLPSFRELVRIAFRNYLVSSFDHPVIKRLRGQI